MPIDISNVLLWCPQCRRGVKVGFRYDPGDGHKERFCRQCTGTLGALSKARPAYVEKT
jgi:large subunit ribosomal protein L24